MKRSDQQVVDFSTRSQAAESARPIENQAELDQMSDEELTQIFIEQSEAFVALYRRYVSRVYSYFAWRFGWSDAEDLTADVFTRALKARTGFTQGKAWRPWLFGIARNRAMEHGRYRKRDSIKPEIHEREPEQVPDAAIEVEENEQKAAIREIVAALPDGQREIVELRFWAGLSYREISEIIGGTEGALRVQTHRTLRELRNRLEGAK